MTGNCNNIVWISASQVVRLVGSSIASYQTEKDMVDIGNTFLKTTYRRLDVSLMGKVQVVGKNLSTISIAIRYQRLLLPHESTFCQIAYG